MTSNVSSYDELLEDMESQEYKEAETAVIDTGGTLVQLMKGWAKKQDAKAAKDGRAMYGVIKSEFDRLCWKIRNEDKKHLVVVFHTTEQVKGDSVQTRLSCEGSTKDIVWTPADFGGHMFMMGNKRMIGFSPTEEYFAKGCFGVSGSEGGPGAQRRPEEHVPVRPVPLRPGQHRPGDGTVQRREGSLSKRDGGRAGRRSTRSQTPARRLRRNRSSRAWPMP